MNIFTRAEYMSSNCHQVGNKEAAAAEHRRYYAQLVCASTIAYVVRTIGADVLRASTDKHFNDIPLAKWDRLTNGLPLAMRYADLGDYPTLGGQVCVAKEAARQWVEQNN